MEPAAAPAPRGTAGSSGSSGAGGGGRRGDAAGRRDREPAEPPGRRRAAPVARRESDGSGATGGSTGGGGSDGGISCRWGDLGACPNGQYCNALGCNSGTCMPLPAEGSAKNPVCGCDGISYWNVSVAAHRGMSVKSTGECSPSRTCAGFAGEPCPDHAAFCNMKVSECDRMCSRRTSAATAGSCRAFARAGPASVRTHAPAGQPRARRNAS